MQEMKRVFRSFVLALGVFALFGTYGSAAGPAWPAISQAQAQAVDPEQDPGGDGVDGGGCSNTTCIGVTSCRYREAAHAA
ncbi:MAG: hypothetical protein AB1941_20635 [Gemmatimonadota bacterium]